MHNICEVCKKAGEFIGTVEHGSLIDYVFGCSCGTSWNYIVEGKYMLRKQVVFPLATELSEGLELTVCIPKCM